MLTGMCVFVGVFPQEECQNYIRVLLVNGNRLFTCGTNAFTPICTNRTVWTMPDPLQSYIFRAYDFESEYDHLYEKSDNLQH